MGQCIASIDRDRVRATIAGVHDEAISPRELAAAAAAAKGALTREATLSESVLPTLSESVLATLSESVLSSTPSN